MLKVFQCLQMTIVAQNVLADAALARQNLVMDRQTEGQLNALVGFGSGSCQ